MKRIFVRNNSDDGRRHMKYSYDLFCMYSDEQMFQMKSVDDPIFVIVPICGQVDMQTHLRLDIAAEYVYLCKILFHCQ